MTAWTAVALAALGAIVTAVTMLGVVLTVRQRRARRENQPAYPPYWPSGQAARWQRTRDDPEHTPPSGVWLPTDHDEPDTLARLAAEWERRRREHG